MVAKKDMLFAAAHDVAVKNSKLLAKISSSKVQNFQQATTWSKMMAFCTYVSWKASLNHGLSAGEAQGLRAGPKEVVGEGKVIIT